MPILKNKREAVVYVGDLAIPAAQVKRNAKGFVENFKPGVLKISDKEYEALRGLYFRGNQAHGDYELDLDGYKPSDEPDYDDKEYDYDRYVAFLDRKLAAKRAAESRAAHATADDPPPKPVSAPSKPHKKHKKKGA